MAAQKFKRLVAAAAGVWSYGICGGQSTTGAGFLQVLQFPLPEVADVPSGPSLDSTPPTMRIKKKIVEKIVYNLNRKEDFFCTSEINNFLGFSKLF
jgi:hypothetical protein